MDKLNSLCKVKFLAHITLGIYSGRCLFNEVQHDIHRNHNHDGHIVEFYYLVVGYVSMGVLQEKW